MKEVLRGELIVGNANIKKKKERKERLQAITYSNTLVTRTSRKKTIKIRKEIKLNRR